MTLGERIKKLRKSLDLTQQEFAGRIGSTQNALTGYETGRRNPSSSVINNICKTFDVSETWLRKGDGEMFVQFSKDDALERQLREFLKEGDDTFRERLISLLLRLPPELWEALEQYAQELVDSRPSPKKTTVSAIAPVPPVAQEPEPKPDIAAKLAELERQLAAEKARADRAEAEAREARAETKARTDELLKVYREDDAAQDLMECMAQNMFRSQSR